MFNSNSFKKAENQRLVGASESGKMTLKKKKRLAKRKLIWELLVCFTCTALGRRNTHYVRVSGGDSMRWPIFTSKKISTLLCVWMFYPHICYICTMFHA